MAGGMFISWAAVAILVSVGLAFTGGLVAAIKWLLDRTLAAWQRAVDLRFAVLETEIKQVHRLERELLEFKALVSEQYVKREDHIRSFEGIDAKLDRLRKHIDQWMGGTPHGRA